MERQTEFVLGLIGSILGIIGALFWLFIGTFFWAGFISGMKNLYEPSNPEFAVGFVISLMQLLFTLPFMIVTLIQSLPASIKKNQKSSGIWLLVVGITSLFINPILFIACVLLIISGSLCLRPKKEMEWESKNKRKNTCKKLSWFFYRWNICVPNKEA